MNALKQRWQSGCWGKATIAGMVVFACMVCGFWATVYQVVRNEPNGAVQATGEAVVRVTTEPEATPISGNESLLGGENLSAAETASAAAGYSLGAAVGRFMADFAPQILLAIALLAMAWLLARWQSRRKGGG